MVCLDGTFVIIVLNIKSIVLVNRMVGQLPRAWGFIKTVKKQEREGRPCWHSMALVFCNSQQNSKGESQNQENRYWLQSW